MKLKLEIGPGILFLDYKPFIIKEGKIIQISSIEILSNFLRISEDSVLLGITGWDENSFPHPLKLAGGLVGECYSLTANCKEMSLVILG